jgi:uncharacterized protein YggU (UPF0235/DUF167 family)
MAAADAPFMRRGSEGIELAVRATPRAGRDGIDGVVVDAAGAAWLAVRVTAPPDGGRANRAVMELLAEALGVPASALRLTAGATSRRKRFLVTGDPDLLAVRVAVGAARDPGNGTAAQRRGERGLGGAGRTG